MPTFDVKYFFDTFLLQQLRKNVAVVRKMNAVFRLEMEMGDGSEGLAWLINASSAVGPDIVRSDGTEKVDAVVSANEVVLREILAPSDAGVTHMLVQAYATGKLKVTGRKELVLPFCNLIALA